MVAVTVTNLRSRLPAYLKRVAEGEEVAVTSHGKVVARIVPDVDGAERSRTWLKKIRKASRVGDIVSPVGEQWEADR